MWGMINIYMYMFSMMIYYGKFFLAIEKECRWLFVFYSGSYDFIVKEL